MLNWFFNINIREQHAIYEQHLASEFISYYANLHAHWAK